MRGKSTVGRNMEELKNKIISDLLRHKHKTNDVEQLHFINDMITYVNAWRLQQAPQFTQFFVNGQLVNMGDMQWNTTQ